MNDTMPGRRILGRDLITEDGTPMMTEVLPREPRSVPVARRLVRDTFVRWQLPQLADTAELVVAELAANTVNHARADSIRITVRRVGKTRVRVAVIDKSRSVPVLREAGDDTEHGRGLALVEAVSAEWGFDAFRWGKRVWADLETGDEAPPDDHHPKHVSARAQATYVLIVLGLGAAIIWSTLARQP